jgi:hypothetical protein
MDKWLRLMFPFAKANLLGIGEFPVPNRGRKDLSEIEEHMPVPSAEMLVLTKWGAIFIQAFHKRERARMIQRGLRAADQFESLGSVSRLRSSNPEAESELRKNRLHAAAIMRVQAHMMAEGLIDDTAKG